jgi:nucleoside-diphosphate-sugar epimerase
MTILFTGHKGFLGRELIPELKLSEEIISYQGDLTNWHSLKNFIHENRVEKIIHAAFRGGRRNKVDTHETLTNNVKSTVNLLRLEIPVVLFCSGAIYNRTESIDEAKEEDSYASYPSDFYGQSKFINNYLAQGHENSVSLRYFNVFGKSEGTDRFITFNLLQYIQGKPMIIFKDFQMDFFFVQDTIPVLKSWINGANLPKEMNLVYREKLFLSEICATINTLSNYKVPIHFQDSALAQNYTGRGEIFESLKLPQFGLKSGIVEVYEFLKSGK